MLVPGLYVYEYTTVLVLVHVQYEVLSTVLSPTNRSERLGELVGEQRTTAALKIQHFAKQRVMSTSKFADFEVLEHLGTGSFGSVYK